MEAVSQGVPRPTEVVDCTICSFGIAESSLIEGYSVIKQVSPEFAAETDFFHAYERRKNYAHPRYESQDASGVSSDASHKRFTSYNLPSLTFNGDREISRSFLYTLRNVVKWIQIPFNAGGVNAREAFYGNACFLSALRASGKWRRRSRTVDFDIIK